VRIRRAATLKESLPKEIVPPPLAGQTGESKALNLATILSQRHSGLLDHLKMQAKCHGRIARRYDLVASLSVYAALIFAGLAVALGLIIKTVPFPAELISLCAAIGTGSALFSREGKLRAKADWFYTVRDVAQHLHNKLEFELPLPVTRDDIAAVSEEWRTTREKLGERMFTINNPEKSKPSKLN
jgi:hypothetical protein